MENGSFTVANMRPARDGMTISRNAGVDSSGSVTWFALGAGTSISPESYDHPTLYLGAQGQGSFLLGPTHRQIAFSSGDFLAVPGKTLCGCQSAQGLIYTEIIMKEEIVMNDTIHSGEAIQLKNLISYEEDSIANIDIVQSERVKFVLMAFDAGTGLQPHRAPGNAIVTALEGKAVIGYEGKEYPIAAGESFRFDKNGLHSVTADGRFKMSLLLILE